MKKLIEVRRRGSEESGFTLLEYCAGAAVIAGIVWGALSALGGNLQGFLNNLGTWVSSRSDEIGASTTPETNPGN